MYELIIEEIQETIKRKQKRKLETTSNESLLEVNTIACKNAHADYEESQRQLAYAFHTLSENIVRYAKFNLIDADDAIQEGVMICFEKIDRFNPNYIGKNGKKAKAFNYMTTCILNHFRQLYRTARNYNELKKKYHDFLQIQLNRTIIKNGKEVLVFHSPIEGGEKSIF
jgi:DNA-directed RNA polymerase specialized sigma24 family protein